MTLLVVVVVNVVTVVSVVVVALSVAVAYRHNQAATLNAINREMGSAPSFLCLLLSLYLHTIYLPYILQVLGTVIFGVGLWLAVDKHSLIALLKLVESERIEVSTQ